MGRHSGHIALHAGIACGALAVLIPEIESSIEHDVIPRMVSSLRSGKQNFIIMVAEGSGKALKIAEKIEELTGIETNAVVLGHVQRGGTPTARERIIASTMGNHAVTLLRDGISKRVVVYRNGKVTDLDIEEALSMTKSIDMDMYNAAYDVSI